MSENLQLMDRNLGNGYPEKVYQESNKPLLFEVSKNMSSGKKAAWKISSWKTSPAQLPSQENLPPEICLPKIALLVVRCSWRYFTMFIFKIFIVTSFRGASRTTATYIMDILVTLVNAVKFNLDVVGVGDFPLSLLGEAFHSYLSVKHIGQLVTHEKTLKVAKSVICKKLHVKS